MTKVMAVGKYLQPDEEFVISDLETIHIVSEPLRLQILEILKETPKTVKMVSKELGVNQVKLYYHFKLLEEHGLLRITEERMVSHLIEKVYQTRARSIRIATDLLTSEKAVSESSETLLAYVFDKARAKLKKGLQEGWVSSDPSAPPQNRFTALRGSMRLAPDQATPVLRPAGSPERRLFRHAVQPALRRGLVRFRGRHVPGAHLLPQPARRGRETLTAFFCAPNRAGILLEPASHPPDRECLLQPPGSQRHPGACPARDQPDLARGRIHGGAGRQRLGKIHPPAPDECPAAARQRQVG